jgi:protoporphyrinogen oxidase
MAGPKSEIADSRDDSADFDVVVLGAGISGLVSASILLEQGCTRVAVVDEYAQVGGNHLDFRHNGYTFDVGSLIFQDDSPLLHHFPELLPRYLPINPSWARLNPQGRVTRYPFSVKDDLLRAGPFECSRILLSAAFARIFRRRLVTARDFARYWLGSRLLYRSGLERYMERFCGLPADQIDLQFAEKRMMWIPQYASVPALARFLWASRVRPSELETGNRQLLRPKEGFAHLYEPAVKRLTEGGVTFLLGALPKTLRRVDEVSHLETEDGTITADRVVSTIPIDRLRTLCGQADAEPLPTVTLVSLFLSFAGDRGFTESILYNFDHDGAWKRLTMYSDFYGPVDGREYFTVEVIAGTAPQTAEEAADDFRRHTAAQGLFDGDLRFEGGYTLQNAYPVYTAGAGPRAEGSVSTLRAFGVESFGRQGGFEYQPTARVSTLEAEAALKRSSTPPRSVRTVAPSGAGTADLTTVHPSAPESPPTPVR